MGFIIAEDTGQVKSHSVAIEAAMGDYQEGEPTFSLLIASANLLCAMHQNRAMPYPRL